FASDVYALAATTFHALTGRAPRQSDTITGLVTAMTEPIPVASKAAPTLGSAFDALLGRALATDPADRPGLNAFTAGLVTALAAEQPETRPAAETAAATGAAATEAMAASPLPSDPDPLAKTHRIAVPTA